MILILCVDDNLGMAFNNRRQSKDRVLTGRIQEIVKDRVLWTDIYSAVLFGDDFDNIRVDDSCLEKAGDGEFCFVERQDPVPSLDKLERLYLFHWNRKYPSSLKLDFRADDWAKVYTREFAGYSHEKITEELYEKK